jgi:peptidoglycan/LPS O-acetylase OafA/YrhL
MTYRPEIDGLRAISVIAVLLFHVGKSWLPAGYIGVDVFFVISGYLITGLILHQIERGQFSIPNFYARRIRRLAPALLTLVMLCALAGYFVLSPGDYETFSRSALYTLLAAGNYFFLYNTGYFDPVAESMPLLHTWSLAVEEQFYLVWPLLLLVAARFASGRRGLLLGIFLVVTTLSFGWYCAEQDPGSAFFLPQGRAWELSFGACLALAPSLSKPKSLSILAEVLPALGLIAICLSATDLLRGVLHPSFWAVVGAAAIIYPASYGTVASRLLSTSVPVFVGKISYSVYLYHWPLIVFWRHYTSVQPIGPYEAAAIIVLSVASGWLSWKFIEQPFRRSSVPKQKVFLRFAGCELLLAAACYAVVVSHGVVQRLPEPLRTMSSLYVMWDWACPHDQEVINGGKRCVVGRKWNEATNHAVIWGDSSAAQLLPILHAAAQRHDFAITMVGGCSPIISLRVKLHVPAASKYNEKCDEMRKEAILSINNMPNISLVILASSWSGVGGGLVRDESDELSLGVALQIMQEGLDQTLAEISGLGRSIAIISDMPMWGIDPVACLFSQQTTLLRRNRCQTRTDLLDWSFFDATQRPIHDLLKSYVGRKRIDALFAEDYLCDGSGCRTTVNNEFIYRDNGHLRRNLKTETLSELADILGISRLLSKAPGLGLLPVSDAR